MCKQFLLKNIFARFGVLTAVLLRVQVFWDVILCHCVFLAFQRIILPSKHLEVTCPLVQRRVVEGLNPQECVHNSEIPLHLVFYIVQGIRDLFWLPIEQYQKDGRIVRGLQRGANSFTTSTAMAALELTNRLVQAIQVNNS